MGMESRRILRDKEIDGKFIDRAVDFIKTYADACHHGKEENILFRALAERPLSLEHRRLLDELINEHVYARGKTKDLELAKERYVPGDMGTLREIAGLMGELADFYPEHIEKEDERFFLPCMDYFDKQEQESMLREFEEFDRKLLHEKYKTMVQDMAA
jgi:hemerythrin-like domain-containing protein